MSAEREQLRLGDEPEAVPRARAFVAGAVPRISPSATDLLPDVELAVTECALESRLPAADPGESPVPVYAE